MGNIYKKIRGASALKKASALKQNGDNPNAINVFKVNSAGDYIQGSGSYDYQAGTAGTQGGQGGVEFNKAFKAARDQGLEVFTFNGKEYNTKLGTKGTDPTFSYKATYPGSTNVKTVEETTGPTTKDYNMGYYEARSAKLGAKQSDKIVNQKKRRQDKDIKTYEKGRGGFLGINRLLQKTGLLDEKKTKGYGELDENVVAAYEHQGRVDTSRFTYGEDDSETKVDESKLITGEKGGDQIVSESMRTGANTLKRNKFSTPVGEKIIEGGETKKITTEESSGGGKIAEGDIKNVKGKNYIEQNGKLFNFTTVDGKVVIGEEFIGKGPGYSTKNIAPFKMTGYGSKDKK